MKKIIRKAVCLAVAAICIVSQTGCAGKEPVSSTDFLLNTVCSITLYDGERQSEGEMLLRDTFALCRAYEAQLSRTVPEGDVGRINGSGGAAVKVDATTAKVIEAGVRYGALSGGLFDITVGELSELWNFSGDHPSVPTAFAIKEAIKHVDYRNIKVEADTVQLIDGQAKLDLGGIAKGYIADKAAEYLKEQGVKSAILNFGGNIVCIGSKGEDQPFSIGVEKPFSAEGGTEKQILGSIQVSDLSVVTSGTYERKFVEKGTLYYHILDPATGYPRETDLDGVSIVGPSSMDCDGLSTTCLMLGLNAGKELIDSLADYEAVFVCKDGKVVVTDGLELHQ